MVHARRQQDHHACQEELSWHLYLATLSQCPALNDPSPAFKGAVANGDVKALSQISGVGKKTAERIVVELKDKIGAAGAWEAASEKHGLSAAEQKINDAVLALMALGFKQVESHDAVKQAQSLLGPQAGPEDLVRACLKKNR